MVTADTVDQAIVSGTLQPAPRPVEAPEAAPAAPQPPPQREAANGAPRRRRRRRRHKPGAISAGSASDAQGRPEVAAAGGAPTAGSPRRRPEAATSESSEDVPVFSEGPEDETRAASAERADTPPAASMPRFADLPAEAQQACPHRRRRRRRRHRGRGGAGARPAGAPHAEGRTSFQGQRDGRGAGGNGSPETPGRETIETPRSEGARTSAPPLPPEIELASSPHSSGGPAESSEGTPGEAKPKRRWWRRSFSRG